MTKEASNPRSSLRSLVVQANMLDNLMDHIQSETEKRMSKTATSAGATAHVSFRESRQPHRLSTSITEYEVDEDSDEDDDDYDDSEVVIEDNSDSDFDSDSDSDYYYSDSEDDEVDVAEAQPIRNIGSPSTNKSYKQLPYINLSLTKELSVIEEEEEEEDVDDDHESMPELTKSTSVSDSEDEYDVGDQYNTQPEYIASAAPSKNAAIDNLFVSIRSRNEASNKLHNGSLFDNLNNSGGIGHQRHNAIYNMEHVF